MFRLSLVYCEALFLRVLAGSLNKEHSLQAHYLALLNPRVLGMMVAGWDELDRVALSQEFDAQNVQGFSSFQALGFPCYLLGLQISCCDSEVLGEVVDCIWVDPGLQVHIVAEIFCYVM